MAMLDHRQGFVKFTLPALAFAAMTLVVPGALPAQTNVPTVNQSGKDAPWVPTSSELVEKMLDMAGVTPQDFVMDLGSGDGRNVIAAAKRGAHALGVEYDPDLVELSRRLAKEAGVADKATFVQGDMYKADVSKATVLALFLVPENLDKLQAKFLAMKPGTRIVLNTFGVTDWDPDASETIGAPCSTWCTANLLIVPAQVAGTWHAGNAEMNLKQYYQVVRGTIGTQNVIGRLRGDQITLTAGATEYKGRVVGKRMEGTATTAGKERPWTATRSRGARSARGATGARGAHLAPVAHHAPVAPDAPRY
jgi:precorrin-6B methylase 2